MQQPTPMAEDDNGGGGTSVNELPDILKGMVPVMHNLNRNATITELTSQSSTRDWSPVLLNLKTIQEASWEIHRWSMMLHEGTLTAEAILDKAAQATQLLSALSDLVPALKEPILRELAARVHPSLLHSEPPTPVFTSPPASPTGQPHLHPQPQPRQPLIATRPANLKDLNFLLPTTMPSPESRNANSLHSSLPSPKSRESRGSINTLLNPV